MNWYSETWQQKRDRLQRWHHWFAWHPVRVNTRIYWLETIYIKGQFHSNYDCYWTWEYAANVFDILKNDPSARDYIEEVRLLHDTKNV